MDEQTHWQTMEPTEQVTNPYDFVPIPPPPPRVRKHLPWFVSAGAILLVCLAVIAGLEYYSLTSIPVAKRAIPIPAVILPTPAPTNTLAPTVNPNYTATDIMNDFNAAGIHPKFFESNRTIWSWTEDTYFVSVHATSSVDFADDSGCTGYCSPADIGVWVYNSQNTAIQAYNDILNDETNDGSIPMMGTPHEVLHGRCLLLGAKAQSIYGQVVMKDCV